MNKETNEEPKLPANLEDIVKVEKIAEETVANALEKPTATAKPDAVSAYNQAGAAMLTNYFKALGKSASNRNLILESTQTVMTFRRCDNPAEKLTVCIQSNINESGYSLETVADYSKEGPKQIN